jgi:hypothetical protein
MFSELYEANKEIKNPWVFEPEYPEKRRIFDGRIGDPFEKPILIGKASPQPLFINRLLTSIKECDLFDKFLPLYLSQR